VNQPLVAPTGSKCSSRWLGRPFSKPDSALLNSVFQFHVQESELAAQQSN
jgi:hypothetical protein